jgi:hypothetical protein
VEAEIARNHIKTQQYELIMLEGNSELEQGRASETALFLFETWPQGNF